MTTLVTRSSNLVRSALAFVIATPLAMACSSGSTPHAPGLRDVTVPADFAFETTREVVVAVHARATTLGASHAALEIALPSGQVLYRGPIAAATPASLTLAVPTKDTELLLRVGAGDRWIAATAAIAAGQAQFTL